MKTGRSDIVAETQRRVMERTVERTAEELEGTMRAAAPVGQSRELVEGIHQRPIDPLTIAIDSEAAHTEEVIFGTSPHTIRSQGAPEDNSLRFVVGGQEVFADEVRHPGTDANPFHERALDMEMPQIPGYAEEAANQAGGR